MRNIFNHLRFLAVIATVLLALTQARGESPAGIIDKVNLRLYLIEGTDTIMNVPVCVGTNYGDKIKEGDRRTPEGDFSICQIQDARQWEHDFKDGAGMRKGAYGPWFLRLKMPRWRSIGIHGTCFPSSIGTRDSEGCIRLHNEDLVKLHKHVSLATRVTILPDSNNH